MPKLTHDANGQELCESCAPSDDEVNHPPGMVFVGWGHGWQACIMCRGSGLAKTRHDRKRTANTITDEELRQVREDCWRDYLDACNALGYSPHGGKVHDRDLIRYARERSAENFNKRYGET